MQRHVEDSLAPSSASRLAVADAVGRAVVREAMGVDAVGDVVVRLPERAEMSASQMQGERPSESATSTASPP